MKKSKVICLLVLIIALVLSSCAAGDSREAPASSATGFMTTPAPASSGDIAAPSQAAPGSSDTVMDSSLSIPAPYPQPHPSSPVESSVALPFLTPSDNSRRQLVYNVELHLQTTEFMPGIRLLVTTISDMGGYIERGNFNGHDMRTPWVERSAGYVFRLHTDRLAEFIVVMEDNFNLLSLRQQSDDVTRNHEFGSSSLSDLREQEAWLREELRNEELEASDKLMYERALAEIQSSIRALESQMSTLDDQIAFSTITVYLSEVFIIEFIEEDIIEQTFGERFAQAASRSFDGFIAFCQGLLIVIIRMLPTLVILAIIGTALLLIIRKYKKYRKANPKKPRQRPQPHQVTPQVPGSANYSGYQGWNNEANRYNDPNNTSGIPNTGDNTSNAGDPTLNNNEIDNSGR